MIVSYRLHNYNNKKSVKILKDGYYYKNIVYRVTNILNHYFGRNKKFTFNAMLFKWETCITVRQRLKLRERLETWGIFFLLISNHMSLGQHKNSKIHKIRTILVCNLHILGNSRTCLLCIRLWIWILYLSVLILCGYSLFFVFYETCLTTGV